MNNPIQLLLVISICILTLLLTFASIQVFYILHEVHLILKRKNRPTPKLVPEVGRFFLEVKNLVSQTQAEIISHTPDRVIIPSARRRFFRRTSTRPRPHLPARPS